MASYDGTKCFFSKIFKVKYFHNRDFLEASLGRSPSYIYWSIHASIGMLKQGVRWQVGDGEHIEVIKRPDCPLTIALGWKIVGNLFHQTCRRVNLLWRGRGGGM